MSYRIGIDYYQTECDEKKEIMCRACKAVMDVSRGVMVRTGPYHPKSKMDTFSCPNNGLPWHDKKVKKIVRKIRDSFW